MSISLWYAAEYAATFADGAGVTQRRFLGLAWSGPGMKGWRWEPIQTGGAGLTDRQSDRRLL